MDEVVDFISIPALCAGVCLAMVVAGIHATEAFYRRGLRTGLREGAAVFLVFSIFLVPAATLIAAAVRLFSEAM